MDCPSCQGHRLVPTKIEEDLAASGCMQCQGALLSLVSYRNWAENHAEQHRAAPVTDSDIQADNTNKALVCPKCSRLMTKYRIGAGSNNRVDLCSGCDEAWLDAGEWALLKQMEVQDKLPRIFTDEWQRRIRREQAAGYFQGEYAQTFGDDYPRIKELRTWIDGHPQKEELRRYLNNPNPYQTEC